MYSDTPKEVISLSKMWGKIINIAFVTISLPVKGQGDLGNSVVGRWQRYWHMMRGKKSNITLYLNISLCRNSRLKRVTAILLVTSPVGISLPYKSE